MMSSGICLRLLACTCIVITTNAQAQPWNHSLYTTSPSIEPSPRSGGLGWSEAWQQAKDFVSQLTLEEKIQLVTGTTGPCVGNIAPIPHMNFSGLCLQDGPLAIRQATFASVFPAGLTTAASWDKGLMLTRGIDMGAEFKGKGAHIALGPVAGPLGRSPYSGRTWEGFSPDPYLTGIAVEQTISGMQQSGVQACIKHFIGNEQETQRNPSTSPQGKQIESVSSNIDDRNLHETYAWPFGNAVKAGVSSVMCSYNRVNGSYACENSKILNGILKTELGFQGYVMSDWWATHSGEPSVYAGLDMDMPGGETGIASNPSYFGDNLKQGVQNGTVGQDRLDDMCYRIMTPYFNLGQNNGYPSVDPSESGLNLGLGPMPYAYQFPLGQTANVDVREDHATLIRELGAAGTVLLKNVNGTLPLRAPKTIAVLGNDAIDDANGQYFTGSPYGNSGFEFGTLPVGGGSGSGRLSGLVSPLEAIKARAMQDKTLVQYLANNTYITSDGLQNLAPSPPEACLVFLKSWAEEGVDRTTLVADWDSTAVVEAVTAICNNTIVITHTAGAGVLPWANNTNVTAILAAHLPGEQSGNSIVDILYGNVNPSGKLPYTIAISESDFSFAPITNDSSLATTEDPNAWQSDFKEGKMIDYKHFDFNDLPVQYEFGFGLSYTSFNMSDLSVTKVYGGESIGALPDDVDIVPGGNPTLWDVIFQVTVSITNVGQVAGAAVPQIYVSLPRVEGEDPPPPKVLRGFEKVSIQPGQSTMVNFDLMRRDLSYWSPKIQRWVIPDGNITVLAGFSSRDIHGNTSFPVVGA